MSYVSRLFRARPAFMIIGGMKCGTSSLFSYLIQHPRVVSPGKKEMHFFDNHYVNGPAWYFERFPRTWRLLGGRMTGEATPYYLFHPAAPMRARTVLPDARLIVLLRDPVYRAFSHYQHQVANGHETLPFEDALDQEDARLAGEEERLLADPTYYGFNHQHYSYAARGRYLEQLLRWEREFDRDRMLVLRAEDLYADTQTVLDRTTAFLGIDPLRLTAYEPRNTRAYSGMAPATAARLAAYFEPYNQRLYEHLGSDFGWTTPSDTITAGGHADTPRTAEVEH